MSDQDTDLNPSESAPSEDALMKISASFLHMNKCLAKNFQNIIKSSKLRRFHSTEVQSHILLQSSTLRSQLENPCPVLTKPAADLALPLFLASLFYYAPSTRKACSPGPAPCQVCIILCDGRPRVHCANANRREQLN